MAKNTAHYMKKMRYVAKVPIEKDKDGKRMSAITWVCVSDQDHYKT